LSRSPKRSKSGGMRIDEPKAANRMDWRNFFETFKAGDRQ
jgi:hypothetical protein